MQDGTSDEVGAPRHFCEDIWAAYRDSGAREPEKDEALDERPGSAPLPELDHERHEQTETPQAPPSTSPEDEREPPSRWAEADPAGVAKPTDDGRSPVVCVPQARGRLYDEDEDGKADFGDVFDLGEILGIDLEQYGLGFTYVQPAKDRATPNATPSWNHMRSALGLDDVPLSVKSASVA